jgi:hypothetical protein
MGREDARAVGLRAAREVMRFGSSVAGGSGHGQVRAGKWLDFGTKEMRKSCHCLRALQRRGQCHLVFPTSNIL